MTQDEKNYLEEVYVDIDVSKIKEICYLGVDDKTTGLLIFKNNEDQLHFSNFDSRLTRINHFNAASLTQAQANKKIKTLEGPPKPNKADNEAESYEVEKRETIDSTSFNQALAKVKDPTLVFPEVEEPAEVEDDTKDGVMDLKSFKQALSVVNKKIKPK